MDDVSILSLFKRAISYISIHVQLNDVTTLNRQESWWRM
jgi:hypothetical protein